MSDENPNAVPTSAGADAFLPPEDPAFRALTQRWLEAAVARRYAYGFSWLGRPIIQVPQDVYAISELVQRVRPDLIIETGIAHGGSLVLGASMLALLDYLAAVEAGTPLDPKASRRRVVGVDIEIRPHNREALEAHPLAHLISLVEGSSIDPSTVAEVHRLAAGHERVLVMLDSNHTHEHVLAELEAYAPLVSEGSYCVVWDTGVEDYPDGFVTNRPWGKGNNPKTAVWAYRERLEREGRLGRDGAPLAFEIDAEIEARIAITAGPSGFLRRTRRA